MITFIVGTDTGIGKTYYGKSLAKQGEYVIKPIETGYDDFEDINESDSHQYALIQNLPLSAINHYFFSQPVSPHLASELDHTDIDTEALITFIKEKSPCVVELAGGLMVPITRTFTQLDLIQSFDHVNVDLVIGNKLGCINHGLMTLTILNNHNIPIRHMIINNMGEDTPMTKDNERVITEYAQSLKMI